MALDLLESINKTSKTNINFIKIDDDELKKVKMELFSLINQNIIDNEITNNKKMKLIGTLPYILMDKTKFPNNESIVKLAENSLNLKISTWQKRGREEMIGLIINKIARDNENKFDSFMDIWKEFIDSKENVNIITNKNEDFVDTWLNFFYKYRERK